MVTRKRRDVTLYVHYIYYLLFFSELPSELSFYNMQHFVHKDDKTGYKMYAWWTIF